MKTLLFLFLSALLALPSSGQQPLNYTIWVDGLVNPQLAKSSLYFLGTGLRAEVSKPLSGSHTKLFAQLGYARFFRNRPVRSRPTLAWLTWVTDTSPESRLAQLLG